MFFSLFDACRRSFRMCASRNRHGHRHRICKKSNFFLVFFLFTLFCSLGMASNYSIMIWLSIFLFEINNKYYEGRCGRVASISRWCVTNGGMDDDDDKKGISKPKIIDWFNAIQLWWYRWGRNNTNVKNSICISKCENWKIFVDDITMSFWSFDIGHLAQLFGRMNWPRPAQTGSSGSGGSSGSASSLCHPLVEHSTEVLPLRPNLNPISFRH